MLLSGQRAGPGLAWSSESRRVKAQVDKLQNRVAAEAHPVVPLPIGQHLLSLSQSASTCRLPCIASPPSLRHSSAMRLHRLKKFAAVTKGPFLDCAVKLLKWSAAHGTTFRHFAAQLVLSRQISDDYGRTTYGKRVTPSSKRYGRASQNSRICSTTGCIAAR